MIRGVVSVGVSVLVGVLVIVQSLVGDLYARDLRKVKVSVNSESGYGYYTYYYSYYDCFYRAAELYGVNPYLLMAIALVESRMNPSALGRNKNGSYDLGIMQINTSWIPYLRKYGIDINHVWDPCYNIHLGAMVLKHCMLTHGNTWKAVDCYNKGHKGARKSSIYVWKVYRTLERITKGLARSTFEGLGCSVN